MTDDLISRLAEARRIYDEATPEQRAERDAAQARVAELEAELGRYREQYGWVMQGYEDMVEQTALKQTITALRARHATAQVNLDDLDVLTKSQTFWYSSNDEECWPGGPYDTREEAEVEAKASEHRLIVEATKTPIRVSLLFGQEEFFEQAEESLYDMTNEDGDPILDFLPEVNLDLQARVRTAIDGWQVAHRIAPVAWRFDSTGPVEIAAWAKSEGGEE